MQRWFRLICVVIGLGLVQSPAHAETVADAKTFVTQVGNEVLDVLNDSSLTVEGKRTRLEGLFERVVDIQWVGRFVLGKHWRSLNDEQQTEYVEAYRKFLIANYVSRFTEYSGEKFNIQLAEQRRSGEYMVRMNIVRPQGQAPVVVDYMIREAGDTFRVFDIIVEGVSMIATQRSEFGAVVSRNGVDALIRMLNEKLAAMPQP